MANLFSRPGSQIKGYPAPKLQEKTIHEAGIVNGGMVTNIDAADIPSNAVTVAKNCRVRYDKTGRRSGKSVLAGTKPNSTLVRKLIEFKVSRYDIRLVRIANTGTSPSAHWTSGGAWTALTGAIPTGGFIDSAVVLGRLVISDGIGQLKEIDMSAGTVATLGNSPKARFVTGFAERAVAASVGNTPEQLATVYWSGNREIEEYDAAVDESAGNQPLAISPAATTDPITGLFSFTNVMIVPRERSIWLAVKQPIASNPFNFYSAVPGVGCDLPGSIALTSNGIVFLSIINGMLYRYVPGQPIEEVAIPVINEILDSVENPADIFSTHSRLHNEYILGVVGDSTTKIWIVNFRNNTWAYDELADVSTVLSYTSLSNYTSVADLTGTVADLSGTVSDLSNTPTNDVVMVTGHSDGEVLTEDATVVQDNSVDFTTEIRSKEFKFIKDDTLLAELRIGYVATTSGSLTLQYSKDSGTTWTTAKTITTETGGPKLLRFNKQVKARRIMWRVTATDGIFDLNEYEVHVYATGESRS